MFLPNIVDIQEIPMPTTVENRKNHCTCTTIRITTAMVLLSFSKFQFNSGRTIALAYQRGKGLRYIL